jgi:HK97 family phage portal protein
MEIKSKIIKALGGSVKKGEDDLFSSGVFSSSASFDTKINGIKEYKSWVYTASNARARRVATLKLVLKKNGEIVTNHPFIELMRNASKGMSQYQLHFGTQIYLDLTGNAYWYISKTANGEPAGIYLLNPELVRLVVSKDNALDIAYYKLGESIILPPEDVVHFKNFNPEASHPYPHYGKSVLSAISWSIQSDNSARAWNFNVFKNSAQPSGFLTTDKPLNNEQIEQIRKNFVSKYGGTENAHKVGVLGNGMTFIQTSQTQKDIEFVQQSQMTKSEILSAFGVPESEIGLMSDFNRANAEASSYVFDKNTVDPLMKLIVDTIGESLLPQFKDSSLTLEYVSPVADDRATVLAEYTQGADKWMTRNEIREREGLAPVDGGDALYQSIANSEIARVPQKSLRTTVNTLKKTEAMEQKDIDAIKAKAQSIIERHAQKKKSRAVNTEAHLKGWMSIFKTSESSLEKKMKTFFDDEQKLVSDMLIKADKAVSGNDIDAIFESKAWKGQIKAGITLITPRIMDYILQGAQNAQTSIGDAPFDNSTPSITAFIEKRASLFSGSVNDTTKAKLITSLKEGSEKGENITELQKRVESIYDDARGYRAKMIARTEISAGANFGAVEQYKQAGITKHEWQVVDPQDDDCLVNAGVTVTIGDAFPSGDDNSPVHPNCQCTTIPIFDN